MGQQAEDKLRLLVVDDETDNLDLLYRTFRRDFEVIRANSAISALQILEQYGEMAIVISDQRMPEMLGTEFLSRTVDRYPDTIRIVLTGYTDVEDLVEAINAGKVFKYITKPWHPNELQAVVQQAAETYRVLKQRTQDLQRTLRRESLFNAITTAIRESLDYSNMLQTIATTLGDAFAVSQCILYPVEGDRLVPATFSNEHPTPGSHPGAPSSSADPVNTDPLIAAALRTQTLQIVSVVSGTESNRLIVPVTYQQELLGVLDIDRAAGHSFWSDEDIELLQEVTMQAALAISQAKLYQRTQEQAEQMRAELTVARQIQSSLLRQTLPQLNGMRVQACCYPAREVGGDFFEVYQHPQGDLWLAVGDVSGKGVPAALFMVSALSLLRRELSQEVPPEPNIVMQNLNRSLSESLISTNCFITMILARYTPATQKLVYANAGHLYPLVWSRTPGAETFSSDASAQFIEPTYLKVRGVPLGILSTWDALAGSLELKRGEVLLLTSDGITEATVPNPSLTSSSMLKQTGLWQMLVQEGQSLDLNRLLSQIQSHNPVQEDDQTILSLEVL